MAVIIFVLFSILIGCQSEIQILDYSNSQLISFRLGEARLRKGSFKLIHVLELSDFERTIDLLHREMQIKVQKNSSVLPFLNHDINQLMSQLRRMKPRVKRSIDVIGTAWKWIAGTPDHEDHQIVVNKINGLLSNNEKQFIINKDTINRINLLTNTTNEILKSLHSFEEIKRTVEETIINKVKILKEEVTNIEYAMQWAKVGVINSFILSEKEIFETKRFLDSEQFPYENLEEALWFADIKVATNESTILYIISLPAIDQKVCEKYLLKPVKINQTIVKIESENILKCNKEIYKVQEECNQFNKLCICNENQIINITDSNCIPPLLTSKKHNCQVINNQHIPSIQELTEGMIFLNQFNGTLRLFGNTTYPLVGTYIISFHNETIAIDNKTFFSKETPFFSPLPAVLQLASNKSQIEEVLSLEMIKELQTNNIDKITSISTTGKVIFSLNMILSAALVVGIIFILLKLKSKSKGNLNITTVVRSEPQVSNLEEPSSHNLNPNPEYRSVNDLPAY